MKINIVIHGTKGGRKIFTPKKISGLLDVTADSAKASAIGQQAYGIRFTADNTIFSKYKIIRDVRGSKRTGFVGFSLSLPNNEKLSGKEIINVLDRVSEEYSQKYVVENNLNEVSENWTFLNDIASEYNTKSRTDSVNYAGIMQSGEKDDAFIYYPYIYKDDKTQKETKFELEDIFDAPFQEEYMPFRQMLFISKNLEGKDENPLNAMRNSGVNLTSKVDLKNMYYYLNNFSHSKGISITANGKARFDKKGENQIRAKWQVEIRYSKDERYYSPIEARGTISDLNSEIHKYLEIINENNIKIKYDAFCPTPKTKTVTFEIKDRKGNPVNDAEISLDNIHWEKVYGNKYEYIFEGEKIGNACAVNVRKGDIYASNKVQFTPEKQQNIEIKMHDIKEAERSVTNENGIVYDFTVRIEQKTSSTSPLEFRDDDIEKEYYIEVSKKDGEYYYSGGKYFCSKSDNKVYIQLNKQESNKHRSSPFETGEHGHTSADYSNKREDNHTECALVNQYEKKALFYRKPKVIAISIVSALIIGYSIWVVVSLSGEEKQKINPATKQDMELYRSYIQEIELNSDSLTLYKKMIEEGKSQLNKTSLLDNLLLVAGSKNKPDTTTTKEYDETLKDIEYALEIRTAIKEINLTKLKDFNYSNAQKGFEEAINSIQSDSILKTIQGIENMSLSAIADKINSSLHQPETSQSEQDKEIQNDNKQSSRQETKDDKQKQNVSAESSQTRNTHSEKSSDDNNTLKQLQGGDISFQELQEANSIKLDNLDKTIYLYLKFFELIKNNNNQMDKYKDLLNEIRQDNDLKQSELKYFLEEILKDSKTFRQKYGEKIRRLPKTDSITLNELKKKLSQK